MAGLLLAAVLGAVSTKQRMHHLLNQDKSGQAVVRDSASVDMTAEGRGGMGWRGKETRSGRGESMTVGKQGDKPERHIES